MTLPTAGSVAGRSRLHRRHATRPGGFILLPVVVTIALVAALAFLLSRSGPMALGLAADDAQGDLARRVAQAGMEHAVWKANHSACTGYTLADTPFGEHTYQASYSAASGSPVDITVTARLADGTTRSLIRRGLAILQAAAAPLALQPDPTAGIDALLDQQQPDKNYGSTQVLYVSEEAGKAQRPVFRYNLAAVPFGARVLEARLELYQLTSGTTQTGPVNVHPLLQAWSEGDGNGDKNTDTGWNNRQTGTAWNAAGGDFEPAPAAVFNVLAAGNAWLAVDLTPLVQQWVDGRRDNLGFMLKAGDTATRASFASSDNSAAWRPRLTVTYACECGQVCAAPQGTGKVLLVVGSASSPDDADKYRKTLFEAWGYTVTYQDDSDGQSAFDTALAGHDVAYVSETVSSGTLGSKLLSTAKGVVYEKGEQNSVLGLASGFGQAMGTGVDIIDTSHAITQGFATGTQAIYRYAMEGLKAGGTLAGGAQVLARWGADAGLMAVDKGAALTSGSAAGRRVMLPLGRNNKFNMAWLNNAGRLLVQRALTWAGEAPVDPLTVGLVAHWKLDETSGTLAEDSAGNHDGTLTNGPTWTTGTLAGALLLDGSNDHLLVPHDAALSMTSALSISTWIKPDVVTGWRTIATKGTVSLQENYWLGLNGKTLVFGFFDGSTYQEYATPVLSLTAGTWQHVAVSFDDASNQLLFYLNGTLVHTVTATTTPVANTGALMIGTSALSEAFDGTLDDVRLYDRALSAAEVAQLATPSGGGGGGGTCSGTFRDEFKATNYSGSDGTLAWTGNWTEVGESDGATSGDEIVGTDQSNYQLRVRDNDNGGEGAMRQADLSDYTSATLTFDYRRVGLDDSNDWVAAQISKNGGAWVELGRFKGSGTDSSYQAASFDISAHIAANVRIRFISSSNLGSDDAVWFDNVQIAVSGCAP